MQLSAWTSDLAAAGADCLTIFIDHDSNLVSEHIEAIKSQFSPDKALGILGALLTAHWRSPQRTTPMQKAFCSGDCQAVTRKATNGVNSPANWLPDLLRLRQSQPLST